MFGSSLSMIMQMRMLEQQQRMQKLLYEHHKEVYRRTISEYRGWLTPIDEPEPQTAIPLLLEYHPK